MGIRVRVLQANHGDSILVSHDGPGETFNLLIDGGNAGAFRYGPQERMKGDLCKVLDELKAKNQHLDLVILTHIDDDHIGGFLRAFKAPGHGEMIKSIWFNTSKLITDHFNSPEIPENDIHFADASPNTSVRQGKKFDQLLKDLNIDRGPLIMAGQKIVLGPFTFTILSPTEKQLQKLLCIWSVEKSLPDTSADETDYSISFEKLWAEDHFVNDTSIANGSSIAFMLEANGHAMLFLGDAHDASVLDSLRWLQFDEANKLELRLLKVSHHGSEYNTSMDFLKVVSADRYVISTNGSKHGLPNKRTVARILASGDGLICFNYPKIIESILLPEERIDYAKRFEVISQIEFDYDD